jgi:CheY-like chemotaxis protein
VLFRSGFFDETGGGSFSGHPSGDYVTLTVTDNGFGMTKEVMDHLFEPFFTTKEIGKGTGLGLATVYGIVKQNNGFITVFSEPGEGTTFKIYLPRHKEKTEQVVEHKPLVLPVSPGNETILVVEDEPSILNMAEIMLTRLGYTVIASQNPNEAIQLAEVHNGDIHLLITDVIMPEMNGRDLARRILSIYPGLKRLFMSGYTADVIAHHGVLDDGVNFIQKPFSLVDLSERVRRTLDE